MIIKELFDAILSSARNAERLSSRIITGSEDMDIKDVSAAAMQLREVSSDIVELMYEIDYLLTSTEDDI